MNIHHEPFLLLLSLMGMLCWFYFGSKAGVIAFIFATLIIVWTTLHYTFYLHGLHVLLLLVIALITNYFVAKEKALKQIKDTNVQELTEKKYSLEMQLKDYRLKAPALERKLYRYTALEQVTEALSSSLLLTEIVKIALEKAFTILGKSEVTLLFLVDEEKQRLIRAGYKSEDSSFDIKSRKGDLFDDYILKQGKPLIVADTNKDFRFDSDKVTSLGYKVRSLISAPLISERRIIGLLRLDSNHEDTYSEDDLRVLDIISSLAATAIRNAQLYSQMEKLASIDSLTGLYVYRHFQKRFGEEIDKTLRSNRPLSLLMIDIDHFKKYNDRYGHTAGDLVLKHIAGLISSVARSEDIAARYGGEEFTLVLTNTDKDEALAKALDLKERIKQEVIMLRRKHTHVTVSIGVVSLPSDAKVKEELIEKADFAMYRAKKTGRDRVCTT